MNFQEQTNHGTANTIVPYNQTRETGLVERNSSFKSEMESAIETMLIQVAELGKYCNSSIGMTQEQINQYKSDSEAMEIALSSIITNDIPRFENAFVIQSNLMGLTMQALKSTKAAVERLEIIEEHTRQVNDENMNSIENWKKTMEHKF